MRVLHRLILFAFQLLLLPGIYAQQAASLPPLVQEAVPVNTLRVLLRVRLFDGTRPLPVKAWDSIIEQGKITQGQESSVTAATERTAVPSQPSIDDRVSEEYTSFRAGTL
jgi:hypothetical protein